MRLLPLIAILSLFCGCKGPDYVLESGMEVFDPHELSYNFELDTVVERVIAEAPETDRQTIRDALHGAALTLEPPPSLKSKCAGEVGTLGCYHGDGEFTVSWRQCSKTGAFFVTGPAIFAHEVGHMIGYDHDEAGVPLTEHDQQWFGSPTAENPINGSIEERIYIAHCFSAAP